MMQGLKHSNEILNLYFIFDQSMSLIFKLIPKTCRSLLLRLPQVPEHELAHVCQVTIAQVTVAAPPAGS